MISILWLDHIIDPTGPFHSIYRVREDTTHRIYCPHLEIHTLELPKWRKLQENGESQNSERLDRWSRLFCEPTVARAIPERSDTVMERIMVKLNVISQEETLRILAENRERDELFHEWATRTQLREATEAGKQAGKREVVIRLLRQRFGTVTEPQLERIAALSVAELDRMFERILTANSAEDLLQGV